MVHSATMEALDWNMEEMEETQMYVDNSVSRQQQEIPNLENNESRETFAQDTEDNQVQPCSSMLNMETIRPEKKRFCSLQIFRFGSISNSSSCSSLDDSVPLLDDEDYM